MAAQELTQAPSLLFNSLRDSITTYAPCSDECWSALQYALSHKQLKRQALLLEAGTIPTSFAYVCKGLLRAYITDSEGNEYSKNFFSEGSYPGSMIALLTQSASKFAIEALEPVELIEINFKRYRELLNSNHELAKFHIAYLEKHWILEKEPREVAFVQQSASERYSEFLAKHPELAHRIPQYHIASHLGITPTQLSRIRKIRQTET